jgi:glycosyltransferase involved in cell wall biosynthesis
MLLSAITPLILTFNEEANIGRVLSRLTWAKQILVVDSGSQDRTVEIASSWPQVRVIERQFDNFAAQLNFGLDQLTTPWVLCLDADYVLSKELVTELEQNDALLNCDGYYANFRYCVNGRPLRGSLYPDRVVLFAHDKARYRSDGHAQQLELVGTTGHLKAPIYHDDRKPLSAWLAAQERYAALEVEKLSDNSGHRLKFVDRLRQAGWVAPLIMPFYCLFAKGLILDGKAGVFYTLQRTYAELLLSLKLLESQRGSEVARIRHLPDDDS